MNGCRLLPFVLNGVIPRFALLATVLLLVMGCSLDATDHDAPSNEPAADGPETAGEPDAAGGAHEPALNFDAHESDSLDLDSACVGCHSSAQGQRRAVVSPSGESSHIRALSVVGCQICHDVAQHGGGTVRLWEDALQQSGVISVTGDRATPADLSAFCRCCHGSSKYASHSTGGEWAPSCTTCHDVHAPSGGNLALVRAVVSNPTAGLSTPVVFTARSGSNSFDDGDLTANDGICQVCHTTATYHRHDGSGTPHYDGETCTRCHPHDTGFAAAGGSCIECHTTAQDNGDSLPPGGRRAVTADFTRRSHHVRADVKNDDCLVCHDMSQHGRGRVRLKDPDDAATVYDYAQASPADLERFCLGCHDGDGASAGGGRQPFSDDRTAADIDRAGQWAASAHATGGATGSGQVCTDCHGNGHGSNLRPMLLPWDDSRGADNTNEEEGFCFGCHASGGVVNEAISNGWFEGAYANFADDLESTVDMHSAHPVRDSTSGHFFDLGGGPQELECTSCHSVHRDTGKYWAANFGRTPVTRLATDEPWGDSSGEKTAQYAPTQTYQAPLLGESGVDLSGVSLPIDGAGNSLLTSDVLPDYNTFCLTCHQYALNGLVAIDWTNEKHGLAAAEPEGPAGEALAAPFDSSGRGHYFLACVDCHEAHGSENVRLIRRSANGAVVPDVLVEGATDEWQGLCGGCHDADDDRHHSDDVLYNKLGMTPGQPECTRCHDPFPYVNCTTSGCHRHNGFF